MTEERRTPRDIAAMILAKLAEGALPSVQVTKVWVGTGSGAQCYGCDGAIARSEVEVEVELASAVVLCLHYACFNTWQEQLKTRRVAETPE